MEGWCPAVHGVTKSWTQLQLNNKNTWSNKRGNKGTDLVSLEGNAGKGVWKQGVVSRTNQSHTY